MAGINPVHASHKLNVIPSARPVRQKVRRFHPDRHRVIQVGVDSLLKGGFIREIKYPKWLANVAPLSGLTRLAGPNRIRDAQIPLYHFIKYISLI